MNYKSTFFTESCSIILGQLVSVAENGSKKLRGMHNYVVSGCTKEQKVEVKAVFTDLTHHLDWINSNMKF